MAQIPPPSNSAPAASAASQASTRIQRAETLCCKVGASASASIGNIGIR